MEGASPVLTLPYLVLMKLEAGRIQDIGDISRMLGFASDESLTEVREVVGRYSTDATEDLESLIVLGKLEHEG